MARKCWSQRGRMSVRMRSEFSIWKAVESGLAAACSVMYWRNSARSKVNNAHVLVPVINEPSRKNQAGTFPFGSSDVTQRIDNAEV
jgi:hypothetical protein